MRLRRLALTLLGLAAVALITALPVTAKDDVKATLTTDIPPGTPAGTELTVAWRLFYVGKNGQQQPFGANGVFVRLQSASGADVKEGFAPLGAYPTGEYEATVVVPEGGIRDIEIGLQGWTSGPTGTRRADLLFPITNDPLPGTGRVASPASSQRDFYRSANWVFVVVAGLLLTFAVLVVARRLRKKRRRAATPATDRKLHFGGFLGRGL